MAREIIVVADSTKLGRASLARVAPLSAIHALVTDAGASPEFVQALREQSITIITA
jgi:DeoR/GlpR family transcriptional regulator of sugar metabolism